MNRPMLAALFVLSAALLSHSARAAESTDVPGLRAQVVQLSRASGDTVTLRVEIENLTNEGQTYDVCTTTLDDMIQRKQYLVLGANGALCSPFNTGIPAHGRVVFWAKYPAPPAAITSIDVSLPHFAPFEDVPLR